MASELGTTPEHVVGCLCRFWSWADQHLDSTNGNAPSVTHLHVDALARVTGFGRALEKVGWLSSSAAGVGVPKYEVHMGKRSKRKAVTSKRVGRFRGSRQAQKCNASVTQDALPVSSSYSSSLSSSDSSSGTEEEHGDIQDFEVWWAAAPKKVGKLKARKAYAAARKLATAETLLAAITAFAASPKARGEFCPHPTTWLNEGRWEDDPATWLDASQGNRKPKPKTLQELMT